MRKRFALIASITGLFGVGACYQEYQPATTPAPQFQPQPITVQGPPGGEIDPGYAYGGPAGEMGGAAEYGGEGDAAPSTDPQSPGYVMGTVTDAEIDATLEGKGYWVEDEEYGRIWRPDATVVGVDFTPYETCGSWVWTDYGWTYYCDWDWGWLPFHYGNWGWFDDYWAWVPDYTWSPGWVEWRSGGGYVGWRPIGPRLRDHRNGNRGPIVRDHRNGVADRGPIVRDHRGRRTGEADWRFVADRDFASGRRIRPSLVHTSVGLSTTNIVARPPVRATASASRRVTDIMKHRSLARASRHGSSGYRPSTSTQQGFNRPSRPGMNPGNPGWTQPSRGYDRRPPSTRGNPGNPGWTRPSRGYDRQRPYTPPSRGYDRTQPSRGYDRAQPSRGYDRAQPSRPYTPITPSRSWQQPSRSTPMTPSAPSRSWQQPSRGSSPSRSWTTPSRGSSSPSRSWTTPSRGSSSPSRSYSPSRSSPPSSSSGSRSYSPSSSGSSHRASPSSSSGSSRSYSSGSSRGSSSSSSSGSSRGSSGGGRRR